MCFKCFSGNYIHPWLNHRVNWRSGYNIRAYRFIDVKNIEQNKKMYWIPERDTRPFPELQICDWAERTWRPASAGGETWLICKWDNSRRISVRQLAKAYHLSRVLLMAAIKYTFPSPPPVCETGDPRKRRNKTFQFAKWEMKYWGLAGEGCECSTFSQPMWTSSWIYLRSFFTCTLSNLPRDDKVSPNNISSSSNLSNMIIWIK